MLDGPHVIARISAHISFGPFKFVDSGNFLNNRPQFYNTPDLTTQAGQEITVQLHATDPDGDAVRYEVAAGPNGLTVDPISGLLSWTPDRGLAGSVETTVIVVRDAFGAVDTASVLIEIEAYN